MRDLATMLRAAATTAALTVGAMLAATAPAGAETVELPSGGTIAYDVSGSGDRTLILAHGYSFSKDVWERVTPLISDRWTVYAYDLRGFGDSDKPETGYDYAAMGDDLAGFMDALRIESAVLGGHSLGGTLIQDVAAARPDRVEALVLANVQARDKPPLGMNDAFAARIAAWGDAEANRAAFERQTPVYFKDPLPEPELERMLAINAKSATPALKAALTAFLTAGPLGPDAWANLDMPILVVASTHDIIPFSTAVGLLDSLPTARLAVIERSGHTPMWERPEAFAAAVNGFLAMVP